MTHAKWVFYGVLLPSYHLGYNSVSTPFVSVDPSDRFYLPNEGIGLIFILDTESF